MSSEQITNCPVNCTNEGHVMMWSEVSFDMTIHLTDSPNFPVSS